MKYSNSKLDPRNFARRVAFVDDLCGVEQVVRYQTRFEAEMVGFGKYRFKKMHTPTHLSGQLASSSLVNYFSKKTKRTNFNKNNIKKKHTKQNAGYFQMKNKMISGVMFDQLSNKIPGGEHA